MKVFAVSGSVRARSSNALLLRAAAKVAPADVTFDFYDEEILQLPHFNPDLDGEGATAPPAVADFRRRLGAADAVMISTPEYAHGVPGALKDALDWIVSSGELERKPVALLAASPSGGQWAHSSLTPTLEVMGARIVFNVALVFTRPDVDGEGRVSNPALLEQLRAAVASLIRNQHS